MKRTLILILILAVLVFCVVLTWYGASTLFADAVTADIEGTAGGLAPVPLVAAVIGTAGIVGALCALALQIGKALKRRS